MGVQAPSFRVRIADAYSKSEGHGPGGGCRGGANEQLILFWREGARLKPIFEAEAKSTSAESDTASPEGTDDDMGYSCHDVTSTYDFEVQTAESSGFRNILRREMLPSGK